jgi:hypothetical protein
MANRFWVGGTNTWDLTAGTKWATTSGGGGGAAVPTATDDVFFDGASGAVTVSLSSSSVALNLSFSGFTGSIDQAVATIQVSGSLTLDSTISSWTNPDAIQMLAPSGNFTITSNGFSLPAALTFVGDGVTGGTWALQDALTITGAPGGNPSITLTRGTFNANNQNVSLFNFSSNNSNTRTLTMGSGTWSITGTGTIWAMATITGLTLNADTSTISLTNTSNTAVTFQGGGATFNNFYRNRGASTGATTFTGANTWSDFKDDGTAAHTHTFPNSTTTVSTWNVSGAAGNLITLQRTGAAGTWTISDASGINSSDYLSISNSTATGGATWYAGANSTNGGGNTGWIFTAPAVTKKNLTLLGIG